MDKTGEIRPDTMENLFSLRTVRTSLRNISLLKKFAAKLATSTPKLVDLFFFWVFFLNIGRSVTGLFVVAKGLLFMTS